MLDRPTLPYQYNWTEAEDRLLRQGREMGLTSSQIAQSLPGRTRSALCGRANRLGLCVPLAIARQRMAAKKAMEPRPLRPRMYVPKPKPVKAVPVHADAPESLQLLCEELKPNSCRYIAGDPKDGGTYCGHDTKLGSSFCTYHHGIVWVRPERLRLKDLCRA